MWKFSSKFSRLCWLTCLGLTLCQPVRADVCDTAPAEPVNDPDNCRPLWEKIGLPTGGDDLDATPVCHTRYVLLHNNEDKTPFWVIEVLNKKLGQRQVQASGEQEVQAGGRRLRFGAGQGRGLYHGSKLDHGHQAASADFSSNPDWMDESFILSNAVPQQGLGFNRGIWKEFEQLVRTLTKDRGELYVITGPVYADDEDALPEVTKKNNACKTEIKFEAPKTTGDLRLKEEVRRQVSGFPSRCSRSSTIPPTSVPTPMSCRTSITGSSRTRTRSNTSRASEPR